METSLWLAGPLCDSEASYNLESLYFANHPFTEVTEEKAQSTVSIKAACD